MEGTVPPQSGHLLELLKKMKQIYKLCDEDEDGSIQVEHLVQLGSQFGLTDQEIRKLVQCLDPNANGRIGFKDFCHAVFTMKGCEEMLKNRDHPHHNFCCQGGDGNPGHLLHLLHPLHSDASAASQTSEGHHDDNEEVTGGLFLPAHSSTHLAPPTSAEEQFEDYGEGEDVEFIPSSPGADDENPTNGFSDLGSSLQSSAGHTPQKMSHLYHTEMMDVYCSQCCKKVNLLNDLEARLKNLRANSPNRKISSTAFGRQLFHHSNFSSSHGSTEDLFRDSIDSCDIDIPDKVTYLEKKVSELENDSMANGDLKSKLKHENTQLVHRVHELEEQVKDQELRAEQSSEEELKRHREIYTKLEKDTSIQIEVLTNRLQLLEEENSEMKVNVCRLKSQTEKLDQEKQRMTEKLEDSSVRLKDEVDLYRTMMKKLWQNRHDFQRERESMQELVEDLRRELDHLQIFKMETENPGQSRNWSRSREIELEHEVKRLRQENLKLRDQNEDLNAQILTLSLYEAKNLFSCQTKAQSLATEIDNASRDQLVDALREQEEINFRLRQYMDKIILAILDHNPSILEIKH